MTESKIREHFKRCNLSHFVREAFKKNNDETYGKFHILGGGISRGSFSICYHERF